MPAKPSSRRHHPPLDMNLLVTLDALLAEGSVAGAAQRAIRETTYGTNAKLFAGVSAVYGPERAKELYGELIPVPAERIVEETKGPKIIGFTYKNKSNNRRRWGHRQTLATIEITGISKG